MYLRDFTDGVCQVVLVVPSEETVPGCLLESSQMGGGHPVVVFRAHSALALVHPLEHPENVSDINLVMVQVAEVPHVPAVEVLKDGGHTLTDNARELFDRNGLFPVDAWQQQDVRVRKPTDIQEIEACRVRAMTNSP